MRPTTFSKSAAILLGLLSLQGCHTSASGTKAPVDASDTSVERADGTPDVVTAPDGKANVPDAKTGPEALEVAVAGPDGLSDAVVGAPDSPAEVRAGVDAAVDTPSA